MSIQERRAFAQNPAFNVSVATSRKGTDEGQNTIRHVLDRTTVFEKAQEIKPIRALSQNAYSFIAAPSMRFYSVKDLMDEQMRLNKMKETAILESKFFEHAENFEQSDLFDKDNLLLMIMLINHPSKDVRSSFIKEIRAGGAAGDIFTLLSLSECSCAFGMRRPNKPGLPNMRLQLENDLLGEIENRFGNSKEQKIVIGSIGSGGCLQDWILLSKLILMGFKNLEIHLADPGFNDEDQERQNMLRSFFSAFDTVRCELIFYPSMEKLALQQIDFDVLHALDWDELPNQEDSRKPKPVFSFTERGFSFVNKDMPAWELTTKVQIDHRQNYGQLLGIKKRM